MPEPMQNRSIKKILVVYKKSKFELDIEKYSAFSKEYLENVWKIQNCKDRIYSSHLRQVESRRLLQEEIFPDSVFISREEIVNYDPLDFDLIVALGGDNHFTYISHYAFKTLILGCNSDPLTSTGELLSFTPESLAATVKSGWANTSISEWTLITGQLQYPDGRKQETYKSVSEITVRNKCPDLISRFLIKYGEQTEEQRCSGLLIYTGAGSTGWILSCTNDSGVIYGKHENYFMVYAREIKNRERKKLAHFSVSNSVTIISEMEGGISIDALQERVYDFPPGTILELKPANEKLKVVVKHGQ